LFSGESELVMDEKGRVSVPKRYHALLAPDAEGDLSVVLTRGFEKCVFLFSKPGFTRFTARLSGQAFAGAKLRKLQRLFFATVYEVKLDSSGRVNVPDVLRKAAGLHGEIVLVGSLGRAELWDRATWRAYQRESEADVAELGELLAGTEDPDTLRAAEDEGRGGGGAHG
jgi:MraZ protein